MFSCSLIPAITEPLLLSHHSLLLLQLQLLSCAGQAVWELSSRNLVHIITEHNQ
jgi:hypothetical protein